MTIDKVVTIANDALYIIIKVSAPILIVSLIVGLIVSIFQTDTGTDTYFCSQGSEHFSDDYVTGTLDADQYVRFSGNLVV